MAEPAVRPRLPSRGDGRQWPAKGEWTYDDYARLPEDGNRYEVIHGVLYVTPAPNFKHQFVIMSLAASFHRFLAEGELGVVLTAPFDILLPMGIASPVEPDLMVFRAGNVPDWEAKNFAGVPDLVVEVLSPSTRSRDRRIKLRAYEEAGVPEYWLVDPALRSIVVYGREAGSGFVERCRGAVGERVTSAVLPGFELEVARLFPRP
jgi:Uma2 family endonuclease